MNYPASIGRDCYAFPGRVIMCLALSCLLFTTEKIQAESVTESLPVPGDFRVVNTSATAITLAWTDNTNSETGFIIQRGEAQGQYDQSFQLMADETVYIDNTVVSGITYYYVIKALGVTEDSPLSEEISIKAELPFCLSGASEADGSNIEEVLIEGVLNSSSFGNCAGYTDFTGSRVGFVFPGQQAKLEIYLGDCFNEGFFAKHLKVFVDWNNDFDFEDMGETIAATSLPINKGTYSTKLLVPNDVLAGNVSRMRVIAVESTNLQDVQPCGNYAAGETEDYALHIVAEPSILPPTNLEVTELLSTKVALQWEDNASNEENYVVERFNGETYDVIVSDLAANSIAYVDETPPQNSYNRYRVKAKNSTEESNYSNSVDAPTDYCAVSGNNVETIITEVVLGQQLIAEADNCLNYVDQTAFLVTLKPGALVEVGVGLDIASCADPVTRDQRTMVYMDWNRDFDFDDPGELVFFFESNSSFPEFRNARLRIPEDALPGQTRMRVMAYQPDDELSEAALGPCSFFQTVQAIDFTVEISEDEPKNVVTTTLDDGPGSLRKAVDDAALVNFAPIVFDLPVNSTINLETPISISEDITIKGDPELNIYLHSSLGARIFEVESMGELTLYDLALSGGAINSQDGGAILVKGFLKAQRVNFENNQAKNGGAVEIQGDAHFVECSFATNGSSASGGAVHLQGNATVVIDASTFFDNGTEGDGGAIQLDGSSEAEIFRSTFSGNQADGDGGAISAGNATLLQISSCTITLNQADADDDEEGDGGGIFTDSDNEEGFVNSSIIAKNKGEESEPSDINGAFFEFTYNILGVDEEFSGAEIFNNNQIGEEEEEINPRLDDLADNGGPTLTHALLPTSPAIDAGDPSTDGTDQIGNSRDASPDIGAVEFSGTSNQIIYVNHEADGQNDGSSWTDAFNDLQDGLAIAQAGDAIWIAKGVYLPASTANRNASFVIGDGLRLYGGFNGSETSLEQQDINANVTVLSGDFNEDDSGIDNNNENAYKVVRIEGANEVLLNGLKITGGNADEGDDINGGGIFISQSSVVLDLVFIEFNAAINYGGGIYSGDSELTLINCWVKGNESAFGGGWYAVDGYPEVFQSRFSENVSQGESFRGGAIYLASIQGSLEFDGLEVLNNIADDGGGLFLDAVELTLYNALFWGNIANETGGAIEITNGAFLSLINSTLVDNTAEFGSGGVNNTSGGLEVFNTILWDNSGEHNDTRDQLNDDSNEFEISNSLVQQWGVHTPGSYGSAGILNNDPKFEDPSSDNYRLAVGSPAINKGDVGFLPQDLEDEDGDGDFLESAIAEDLDGNPRVDGPVDLGAFETELQNLLPSITAFESTQLTATTLEVSGANFRNPKPTLSGVLPDFTPVDDSNLDIAVNPGLPSVTTLQVQNLDDGLFATSLLSNQPFFTVKFENGMVTPESYVKEPVNDSETPYTLVKLAEIDGDHLPDLVYALENEPTVFIEAGLGLEEIEGKKLFGFTSGWDVTTQEVANIGDLAFGDFNSDGHTDIAAAILGGQQFEGSISVLLNNGAAEFNTFNEQPPFFPIDELTDLETIDINGDGILDLVLTHAIEEGGISIMLGKGDGSFASVYQEEPGAIWLDVGFEGITTRGLGVADFNKDGILDLATIRTVRQPELVLLEGLGDAAFGHPQSVQQFGSTDYPVKIAEADFNNDGWVDLVLNNQVGNELFVYLNNQSGGFDQTRLAVGFGPKSTVIGDFNGDGKHDIATQSDDENKVQLFLGDGGGLFEDPVILMVNDAFHILTGDFNVDGKADLAYATNNPNLGVNEIGALLYENPFATVEFAESAEKLASNPLLSGTSQQAVSGVSISNDKESQVTAFTYVVTVDGTEPPTLFSNLTLVASADNDPATLEDNELIHPGGMFSTTELKFELTDYFLPEGDYHLFVMADVVPEAGVNYPSVSFTFSSSSITLLESGVVNGEDVFSSYQFLATTPSSPESMEITLSTAEKVTGTFAGSGALGYLVLRYETGTNRTSPNNGQVYQIGQEIAGQKVIAVGSNLDFSDLTVVDGVSYIYDVYAYNGVDEGTVYSITPASATTTTPLIVPDVPTNLTFPTIGATAIGGAFMAGDVVGEGYLVLRRLSGTERSQPENGQEYTVGAEIDQQKVVSTSLASEFLDDGLDFSTTYIYDVYAYNGTGEATAYTQGFLSGTVTTLPSAGPTPLASTNFAPDGFQANWEALPGAESYRVELALEADFTNIMITTEDLVENELAYSDLDYNLTYFTRIQAIFSENRISEYSDTQETFLMRAAVTEADSIILALIYQNTDGQNWENNDQWLTGRFKDWEGVEVTANRVTKLVLPANNMTGVLPVFEGLAMDELIELDLSHNQLSGALSEDLGASPALVTLNIENNEFTSIPDFSLAPLLTTLNVKENRLQFDQLEPNVNVAGLQYTPQKNILMETAVLAELGENVVIDRTTGGSANSYKWLADNEARPEFSGPAITLNNVTFADEASFTVQVTSALVPNLVLVSEPFVLRVSSLERDSVALRSLYNNTNGPDWINNGGWLEAPLENWNGVQVEDFRVTRVNLGGNNLRGYLPGVIADMGALEQLILVNNSLDSLGDLTGSPLLSTLDVSQNNLEFDDLERNLGITNFLYANQRNVGLPSLNKLEVGEQFTVSITIGGANNQYQWFRNDQPVEGATGPEYHIPDVNYDTQGDFVCQVTNSDVPDLAINSNTIGVFGQADIGGIVFEQGELIATEGEMLLFQLGTAQTGFDTVATAALGEDGAYFLENIILDDYLLFIQPDTSRFVPVYYPSAINWGLADTIRLRANVEAINLALNEDPPERTEEDGDAGIIGVLEEEFEDPGGRILARRRVARAGVYLARGRAQQRVLQEELIFDEIIAYIQTDLDGKFNFNFIEPGSYQVTVEYPGVPVQRNIIEIFPGKNNQVVELQATIGGGIIAVEEVRRTGLADEYFQSLSIYPNPSSHILQIKMKRNIAGDLKLALRDLSGKLVETIELNYGIQELTIDVSHLREGIYLLSFEQAHVGGETIIAHRIVIQR